ncbi:M28 family peptidase [Massilia sp. CCM 9210]|uniref:M28 family peptidase n=1 Tax=Massilia scottii TaxID=3057166 RepID=UPI002796B3BF|nr:M28 family peptidase [Massilia sp. CCM 9210]MDQ1817311.1 M28 family peptidase [Massilia sp. CCM 9210]
MAADRVELLAMVFIAARVGNTAIPAIQKINGIRLMQLQTSWIFPVTRRGWLFLSLRMIFLVVAPIASMLWYMLDVPGESSGTVSALATPIEQELAVRLRQHVVTIASKEHNTRTPRALRETADYIDAELSRYGYKVEKQVFQADDETVWNLEVEIKGTSTPDEIVIIGAHYDSAHGSPGANDNGSGTAMVLELARRFRTARPERTLRFVLFTNEEPPHFSTTAMGSLVYANRSRARKENIVAMLSLETIGYYSDAPGSQRYPIIFKPFFPDVGNFVAIIGDLRSRELVQQTVSTFRKSSHLPSEGIAAFPWIKGIDWSDHSAFWTNDYRALMITDTAIFRYPHYHTKDDTPEKLNYPHIARLFSGIRVMVEELAVLPKPAAMQIRAGAR